jgi:hypothetical protein
MSNIITADLHCWLNGQASVGYLPLAENKLSDFVSTEYSQSHGSSGTILKEEYKKFF